MEVEALRRMIEEDEFGLLKVPEKRPIRTGEERLVAAFTEVVDFVQENGREPQKNPQDMIESRLAARLVAMASSEEQRTLLAPHDDLGLLREPKPPESLEELLASDPVGLLTEGDDLFSLKHVPKHRAAPDRMARRKPCEDFDRFRDLFAQCHADLRTGVRRLQPFKNPQQIREGLFFVLNGVLVYIAHIGERRQDATGDSNARMRCIFENGTESDLLLRSLASQLYQDGKRVTDPQPISDEPIELDPRTEMGVVYVLKSRSEDPQIKAIPHLHKIGCTVRTTEQRIQDAVKQTTYLMNPVDIVAEYLVPAGTEAKYELLLHRLFSRVRLDAAFERDGKREVEPREWFSVPLGVIDEALELIQAGTIVNYEYVPEERRLRLRA